MCIPARAAPNQYYNVCRPDLPLTESYDPMCRRRWRGRRGRRRRARIAQRLLCSSSLPRYAPDPLTRPVRRQPLRCCRHPPPMLSIVSSHHNTARRRPPQPYRRVYFPGASSSLPTTVSRRHPHDFYTYTSHYNTWATNAYTYVWVCGWMCIRRRWRQRRRRSRRAIWRQRSANFFSFLFLFFRVFSSRPSVFRRCVLHFSFPSTRKHTRVMLSC